MAVQDFRPRQKPWVLAAPPLPTGLMTSLTPSSIIFKSRRAISNYTGDENGNINRKTNKSIDDCAGNGHFDVYKRVGPGHSNLPRPRIPAGGAPSPLGTSLLTSCRGACWTTSSISAHRHFWKKIKRLKSVREIKANWEKIRGERKGANKKPRLPRGFSRVIGLIAFAIIRLLFISNLSIPHFYKMSRADDKNK